jgi:hypothetical protein
MSDSFPFKAHIYFGSDSSPTLVDGMRTLDDARRYVMQYVGLEHVSRCDVFTMNDKGERTYHIQWFDMEYKR